MKTRRFYESKDLKMTKENRKKIITFRLSDSEYEPYEKKLKKLNMTKSSFFREVFITKSDSVHIAKEKTQDNKRLLFLANKSSNNINQIAKKLNSAYRSGVVTEKVYLETLNNLISLERSFGKALEKC